MQAGRLFAKGMPQAEVARRFGATRTAALYWHRAWKRDKKNGLRSKGKPGFTSRLTEDKRRIFKRAIERGPEQYGFETQLWTLSRLASVMRKTTGVRFGHNHTWEIVRSLGFTCQKPRVKARERDEKAIAEWKAKRLPGLKKMGGNAWIFSGLRG
jgi:transposase